MTRLKLDEQAIYFFAFRYALPRQSYALSLVSHFVMERAKRFEDWQLQDMVGEIEAYWNTHDNINSVDFSVQKDFWQQLQSELLKRNTMEAK